VAAIARRRFSSLGVVWLALGAAYFLVPLLATLLFSLKTGRDHYGLEAYQTRLTDPAFTESLFFSLKLAGVTILLVLLLLVPTAYWVHLRLPRLRPVIEFVTILPFVIPPIVLVVGLLRGFRWTPSWFYGGYLILVVAYGVLALPYAYRSLDAGLRAIDIHTLTEAAQSLGARWTTILFRVILPNLRSAVLSATFLTLALVMGEFTMGQLLQFPTFAVHIAYIGQIEAQGAAALSLISFAITWTAMLGLLLAGRRIGGRAAQFAGTH
jgi:putative spermidine/putrescine transport system permease protein